MDAFAVTMGIDANTLASFISWLLTATVVIFSGLCLIGFYDQVIQGSMDWIDVLIKVAIIMAALTFLTAIYI